MNRRSIGLIAGLLVAVALGASGCTIPDAAQPTAVKSESSTPSAGRASPLATPSASREPSPVPSPTSDVAPLPVDEGANERTGLEDATSACTMIRDGLNNGSIGVPADPSVVNPAVAQAQSAAAANSDWDALSTAMQKFATDAADATVPPSEVNQELSAVNAACAPTGIAMPSA